MEQTMGKRIMENRKRLKLTQDQLAEQLGVTPQAVSKWENDQSCPDISMLPRLAEIFGISTDELLGRTPQTVHEAEVVTEEAEETEGIHIRNDIWDLHWDSGRKEGIAFACLVAGRNSYVALQNFTVGCQFLEYSVAIGTVGLRFGWTLPQILLFPSGLYCFRWLFSGIQSEHLEAEHCGRIDPPHYYRSVWHQPVGGCYPQAPKVEIPDHPQRRKHLRSERKIQLRKPLQCRRRGIFMFRLLRGFCPDSYPSPAFRRRYQLFLRRPECGSFRLCGNYGWL